MGTGGSMRRKGTRDAITDERGNVGDQAQKFDNQGNPIRFKVFQRKPPEQYAKSVN